MARFAIEQGARYGGVNNMLAIALVLRNRVFKGWGDWLEVVSTAAAKCANEAEATEPANLRSGNVRVLLNRIDEVYTRAEAEDITGGALFYVDPARPVLPWFRAEVLDKAEEHARVAHIGPVWFYK
jgi:hypothetical protein